MGALSDISTVVAAAFDNVDQLADAVSSFSYITIDSTYDSDTGVVTKVETTEASRCIPVGYTEFETQQYKLEVGDVKLLVLQDELVATPYVEDRILYNSREWQILSFGEDPATVTWSLFVRSVKKL